MKVLRLHAPGDLRLHEESVPAPSQGEVLVRVKAVGICGSDLHWFGQGGIGDARLDKPLVLGHEFAGVIAGGHRQGERVAVDPAIPCHVCEYCQHGNPNLCTNMRFAGHATQDGALCEVISWPEECLYPLPDTLTFAEGAMLEPLGVALHAMDLGKVRVGMTVGIFGAGPIGALIVQLARLAGAKSILVTDKLPHRLETARRLGASQVIRAGNEPEIQSILTTSEDGVDVAFEAAGENDAVETAMAVVRPGGRVILAGIPDDDHISFSASVARRKGLTIKMVRRMKFTYPRAIQLVQSGQVDLKSLVTQVFPLEQGQLAFTSAARREGQKCIIEI
jgi:L-iditol 2-dehydrogenase